MACSEKSILLIEDEQNILEALSFICVGQGGFYTIQMAMMRMKHQ